MNERFRLTTREMSLFLLWSTEGYLVGVAVIDACPPESDARGALFGSWRCEVTGVVVEVTHPS